MSKSLSEKIREKKENKKQELATGKGGWWLPMNDITEDDKDKTGWVQFDKISETKTEKLIKAVGLEETKVVEVNSTFDDEQAVLVGTDLETDRHFTTPLGGNMVNKIAELFQPEDKQEFKNKLYNGFDFSDIDLTDRQVFITYLGKTESLQENDQRTFHQYDIELIHNEDDEEINVPF